MIPISKDVRQLVGDWAEQVDNRSLLYEKFSLPKVWGQPRRLNDAGRWSVLRIVSRGADLLKGDAQRLRREASGRNVSPDVARRKIDDALIADIMSNIARLDAAITKAANDNASRFLKDLEQSFAGHISIFEATLGARLMVNMAGGVVENAGICLDRCFGLPLLPGSAVKGITRSQALWEIRKASPDQKPVLLRAAMRLFGFGAQDISGSGAFAWAAGGRLADEAAKSIGARDYKGCASFLPAYPITQPTLVVDMVNPHYCEYYAGRNTIATDNDNPKPNYFPAVEAGCTFGFAVLLSRLPEFKETAGEELLKQARQWVEHAVTRKGAGAKTAAGYGWFTLGRPKAAAPQPGPIPAHSADSSSSPVADSPADAFIIKWRDRLSTKDNFPAALPELEKLVDSDLKRAFEAAIPENERRKLKKGNPYWQSFTSGKHEAAGKNIIKRLNIKLT